MGQIQSSVGLVTGIAIEDTVNQLMEINSIPRNNLLSRTELLQQEQTAVTELMTLVVGVELTTNRLGQSSLFSVTKAESSNTNALTVQSSGSPAPGNYSFVPVRQAQSQQLSSSLFASQDQTLSAGEVVIHTGGFLDESANLDTLNGGQGIDRGFIRITDRSGIAESIDLRFAQTANDVVDAINAADNLRVVASIEGDHFVLTDVSGSTTNNLSVEEVGNGSTAANLGFSNVSVASSSATGTSIQSLVQATPISSLRDGRGLDFPATGDALQFSLQDGSTFNFSTDLVSNTASIGQLIDELNAAGSGSIEARISSDGKAIEIEDLTSGGNTFSVTSPNGSLAEQLGLDNSAVSGVVTGDKLIAGLNDILLSSLNGGGGLGTLGQITITDRSGASDTIDLSSAETIQDVLDTINASSAGVSASLNSTKTGIEIVDTTGSTASNLILADADGTNSATALQIEGSFAQTSVDSESLNLQHVTLNTKLSDFNQGRGVNLSTINFTDSRGVTESLNLLSTAPQTIGEVIDEINSLSLSITASINDTGDGIVIEDTGNGSGTLTISDTGTGTAAAVLGIAGEATSITVGGTSATGIDGSQTIRIDTTSETSVSDLAEAINALSNSPVSASILNLNSSGGVRLLLNSNATGTAGRVAIDSDVGIGFTETAAAADALLAFGASDSSGGVLVASSDNDFTGLVEGLDFTITGASSSPVTVTVTDNSEAVTEQIETFVEQFNKLRDRLDELTAFDSTTQTVGLLFGKNSALRVDIAYSGLFSRAIRNAGDIGSLGQLGIRLNDQGKLDFDKAKFTAEYEQNSAAVEEFFTKEDTGFSARAKSVADSLAGVDSGALLNRSTTLSNQIDQNNSRIASLDIRLSKQRTRLLTQFYNMETTIARLQQNLTALNQLQVIPPLSSASSAG